MTPLAMFGLGVPELLIILAVVLLLFGGSRLAGLGKSTGRALKEFKEETKGIAKDGEQAATLDNGAPEVDQRPAVGSDRPAVATDRPAVATDRPVDAAGHQWPQQPSPGVTQDQPTDVRKDL